MRRAQQKVEPVLDAFRDVVLSMKHQLNARALTGMRGELDNVEREVDALVREMNRSIEEASRFLGTLKDGDPGSASTAARSIAMEANAGHRGTVEVPLESRGLTHYRFATGP